MTLRAIVLGAVLSWTWSAAAAQEGAALGEFPVEPSTEEEIDPPDFESFDMALLACSPDDMADMRKKLLDQIAEAERKLKDYRRKLGEAQTALKNLEKLKDNRAARLALALLLENSHKPNIPPTIKDIIDALRADPFDFDKLKKAYEERIKTLEALVKKWEDILAALQAELKKLDSEETTCAASDSDTTDALGSIWNWAFGAP